MTVTCFGILVADVFLPPLAHFPRPGELMVTEDFLFQPGGCAANTARDLARLGVGAAVRGTVGADVFGDLVKSQLGDEGIDVTGVARTDEIGTSKTVILDVPGEDRRYIHTIGANAAVRAADLDGVAFSDGDVLYVGGYLVLPGLDPEGLAARLASAQQAGARTVLDVCVPADGEVRFEDVAPLLPYVDLFVPNEDEARVLSGAEEPSLQAEVFLSAGRGCGSGHQRCRRCPDGAGNLRAELPAPARPSRGRLRSRGRLCRRASSVGSSKAGRSSAASPSQPPSVPRRARPSAARRVFSPASRLRILSSATHWHPPSHRQAQ